MMVGVKLCVLIMMFLFCEWQVKCENLQEDNWSLYQKVQSIHIGLIQHEDLTKYLNSSFYSKNDNNAFGRDRTKIKRTYNTEQCIKDLEKMQSAAENGENWPIEMLATWGRLAAADFTRDYGNFDRCHDFQTDTSINIETQYCLSRITICPDNEKCKLSNVRQITPNWADVGMCLPNSCAPSLIAAILNDYLDANDSIQIVINASECRLKKDNTTFFLSYKIFIGFLGIIFCLVFLSSIYDIICTVREEEKNPTLLSFSAYTNGKNLFKCKRSTSPNVISCLDGIRAIAALWIVAIHFIYYASLTSINPNQPVRIAHWVRLIFNCGPFSVDSFFVMGGILAANKMLQEFSKNGRLNIPLLYLQRILRLSPILIVIALFHRFLLQFCVNGPIYNNLIDGLRYICENSIWDTLLFYVNINLQECVRGAWYLAADMQLYLLTPFMVLLLQRYPKRFIGFSCMIILIDFILALNWHHLGWKLDIYYSARSRMTPWLMGVNFAYLLKLNSEALVRIPKFLNIFLLTAAINIFLSLIYRYGFVDQSHNFLWKGRMWWSLSLCYCIFACHCGQGGIINWFLSQPIWQPLSRLSFNIFLLQQTVMPAIFTDRKLAWQFTLLTEIQEYFWAVTVICAIAAVLAMTIEMPVANLMNIHWKRLHQIKMCKPYEMFSNIRTFSIYKRFNNNNNNNNDVIFPVQ